MKHICRVWCSAVLVAGLSACTHQPTREKEISSELVVLADSFNVAVINDRFIRGVIPFRFTNRTRQLLGVGSCHGTHPPTIETLQDGEWKTTYTPVVLLCDGPPILVRPGATHSDSLRIGGCTRGPACSPSWESDVQDAQARLAWTLYRLPKPVNYSSELSSGTPYHVTSPLFRIVLSGGR
jgi:hypothetical protein